MGTPARLISLLDKGKNGETTLLLREHSSQKGLTTVAGALSVEHLERLVVDASHIDQKKRGVMDMADTMMPLARFLVRKEFKERYAADERPLGLMFY